MLDRNSSPNATLRSQSVMKDRTPTRNNSKAWLTHNQLLSHRLILPISPEQQASPNQQAAQTSKKPDTRDGDTPGAVHKGVRQCGTRGGSTTPGGIETQVRCMRVIGIQTDGLGGQLDRQTRPNKRTDCTMRPRDVHYPFTHVHIHTRSLGLKQLDSSRCVGPFSHRRTTFSPLSASC